MGLGLGLGLGMGLGDWRIDMTKPDYVRIRVYCANARNDIPELIDRCEKLESVADAAGRMIDNLDHDEVCKNLNNVRRVMLALEKLGE
jgi:hypothetical protein